MTKRLTIEAVKDFTTSIGYEFISGEYKNNSSKLKWKCPNGHFWEASYNFIQRGTRCCLCWGKNIKYTREEVEKVLNKKNIKLISEYKNSKTHKIKVECNKGHVWEALYANIKRKSGCPKCNKLSKNKDLDISKINDILSNINIKCLSNSYSHVTDILTFKCENDHVWDAECSKILRSKKPCPICRKNKKVTIEKIIELTKIKGWECLSETYNSMKQKIKFKCIEGHVWEDFWRYGDNRCPDCVRNTFLTEEKCRHIIEKVTLLSFPKKKRAIYNSLELDGYNSLHKMAFEYNGEQHYFKKTFNRSEKDFISLIKRDIRKKKGCEEMGIKLIVIPFVFAKNDKSLIKYLIENIKNIFGLENKKINHDDILKSFTIKESKIENLKNIAKAHGGLCLSNNYLGSDRKIDFSCSEGHQWSVRAYKIFSGKWCPICAKQEGIKKRKEYYNSKKEIDKNCFKNKWDFNARKESAIKHGGRCIWAINKNTGEITEFPSISNASVELKVTKRLIQFCLNGTTKKSKDWTFSFEKPDS